MTAKPKLTKAQQTYLSCIANGQPYPRGADGRTRGIGRVMSTLRKLGLIAHQPHPTKQNLVVNVVTDAGREWIEG